MKSRAQSPFILTVPAFSHDSRAQLPFILTVPAFFHDSRAQSPFILIVPAIFHDHFYKKTFNGKEKLAFSLTHGYS